MHLITHKVTKATRSITDEQLEAMKATPFVMNQYIVNPKPEEPEEVTALKKRKNKVKVVETIVNPEENDNGGQDGNETTIN